MSDTTTEQTNTFSADFQQLLPLIRQEWPQVPRTALEETAGDYDALVAVIANKTEHTRALVGKQLDELRSIASQRRANTGWLNDTELRRLREMLNRLQHKSNDVAGYVRERLATDARSQVDQNPLVTLLMALGLGFVLGFMLRGSGGRR